MRLQEDPVVLFFLRRIGPYHHARFERVAEIIRLTVVETRPSSQEYPWEFRAEGKYASEKLPVSDRPESGIRGRLLHASIDGLMQKQKPDVIVTTGWADPEYHAAVLAGARKGIPLVVISDSRHEDEPRAFYKEFVKRIILRSYSAALVAGAASRQYIVRLGFDPSRIFQPWDVVDNQYFSQRSTAQAIPYEKRYFLCVSRFIPKKNLLRLLEAFARYCANGGTRELVLLGSGELESAIQSKITQLELNGRVALEGFIQYDSLPGYFSRALCLILPSISDQWGLVVNEAMASGLPVLVSDRCGCAVDLVREKSNGCTFDPFRVEAIAEALILQDEQDERGWKRMSGTSRQIIEDWDLKNFSEGLLKACLTAQKRPSRRGIGILHAALSR